MESIIVQVMILFFSLIILIKSSHWVIESSIKLSHITRLSEMAVGFLLVSIATSLPELFVSISSVMSNNIGISIGNLLGSNVADLALIIGIAAIIAPIKIGRKKLRELSTILFLASAILIILLGLTFISKIVGLALILVFVYFAYFSIKKRIKLRGRIERPPEKKHKYARYIVKTIVWFAIGIIGLLISSRLLVDAAANIASVMGIAEAVIGATVIAIGTSLPELSVAITAIRKHHLGLALGDAIGATLVNISLILGSVLLLSNLTIDFSIFSTLILFVLLTNIITWYFMTKGTLNKKEGIVLLLIYQLFIITILGVQISII